MWRRRVVNTLLSCALIILSIQTSANAAIIPTGDIIRPAAARSPQPPEQLLAKRLEALGIPADRVQERLGRLTAEERDALAARMDELPAGGDAIGALAFVALVLLITDILGYTEIYPFVTHTVNEERTTRSGDCPPDATVSLQR
jgi:hypothetical protein